MLFVLQTPSLSLNFGKNKQNILYIFKKANITKTEVSEAREKSIDGYIVIATDTLSTQHVT